MAWFKFSKQHAMLQKQLEDHHEKIAVILVEKASCADVIKLGNLVEHINQIMLAHHQDATIHRNRDFEQRIEGIADRLDKFAQENRDDHQAILKIIRAAQ